jgi:hypothetical protein
MTSSTRHCTLPQCHQLLYRMSLWEVAEVRTLPVERHITGTDKKCDMSWRGQDKCDDGFISECFKTKNYCGILQLPSYRHLYSILWLASLMYINKPFHYQWIHMLCWWDAQVSSKLSDTGRYLLLQVGGCVKGSTGEWKLWYAMIWGVGSFGMWWWLHWPHPDP